MEQQNRDLNEELFTFHNNEKQLHLQIKRLENKVSDIQTQNTYTQNDKIRKLEDELSTCKSR